jgi:glycerol-3-phosphate dehydrogenase (NAD(P)+)
MIVAPLIDAINLLIGGNTSITDIVAGLMSRPLKRED